MNIETLERFGLVDDCSAFTGVWEYCRLLLGSAKQAAKLIKTDDIVVNFDGGRHHGMYDKASGYCYVNDIVHLILCLLPQKVLYIDLDVHYGDGVDAALRGFSEVFTFHTHLFEPGFFPTTGEHYVEDGGCSLNFPRHTTSDKYVEITKSCLESVLDYFQPSIIVVCCGVDGLRQDPNKAWMLDLSAYVDIIEYLKSKGKIIVLGGGGYNHTETAKCWANVLLQLADQDIQARVDIPDHEFIDMYGPMYQLVDEPHTSLFEIDYSNVLEQAKKIRTFYELEDFSSESKQESNGLRKEDVSR